MVVTYVLLILFQNATYTAVMRAQEQLKSGQTNVELAHTLVDASQDVLALALDKQVSDQASINDGICSHVL